MLLPLVVTQGVYVLMSGLDYERLVLSAGPLGIMQASDRTGSAAVLSVHLAATALLPCHPAAHLPQPAACRTHLHSALRCLPAAPLCRLALTRCCRTATSAPSLGSASESSRCAEADGCTSTQRELCCDSRCWLMTPGLEEVQWPQPAEWGW